MRSLKKLSVLAIAVLAIAAIGAASASASSFTASATGKLVGKALNTQTFTTNGGTVKCTAAKTTGEIKSTTATSQHVTVEYSGCTAFGFASVTVSPATYLFTAEGMNNKVHIENEITINVPLGGCKVTVGKTQTVGTVTFDNNSGKVKETSNVSGISYTSSGGLCGSSGSNGTYVGDNEIEREGGGTVSFDE